MILRRITEHVKAQNWFAVVLDFVIVVAGVFVGIQVSNWNAARIEHHAAQAYIERIREDIRQNDSELTAIIAYYRQVKAHALAALQAFENPQGEHGEKFLVDAFQASQLVTRPVHRSTYDEILSVGAMNSIPSVAARRRLANFYQNVEAIETLVQYIPPYRDNLRALMPYPVQAAIFARCDDVIVFDQNGAPVISLPERCDLGLTDEVVAAGVAAIFHPEIERDLVRRLSDLETKLAQYQHLIDRGRALDAVLAEAEF